MPDMPTPLPPLPEREAFARWMADTHTPALRRMDADGAHAAGYAAGYAAAVAAERERWAQHLEAIAARRDADDPHARSLRWIAAEMRA